MKCIKSKWVLGAILLGLIVVVPVVARGPIRPGGRLPRIGLLYLVEKDPATWEVVDRGAWGKLIFRLSAPEFSYVFNGHRLEPDADYTLIYYPDPWPGNGLICLGSGTSGQNGNVHIRNSIDTGDLPTEEDENYACGAKIWLVLSEDVNCPDARMAGWSPTKYLFEYNLIKFNDTDDDS
jgi:hypothetical protein